MHLRKCFAQPKKSYPEIEFMQGDAVSFNLKEKADAVFSNAVFHWIDDRQKLVKNLNRQLKKGGELVFEFGGKGCAETVHGTLEKKFLKYGLKYPRVFYFPTISEFAALLEQNGFLVRYALLFDRPTLQRGENGAENWINMFVKKPFEGVDEVIADKIKKETVEELKTKLFINGKWYIDYVRIRMRAEKAKDV